MIDDGRELNFNDLIGKDIKLRWKVPVQIYRRNGTYFPEDDGEVAAMLDVGYFVGLYWNEKTQRNMIEMIDGEEFEGDSRKPLYTYDNENLDMSYIRAQYFKRETDSQGWFGGVLDGNVADLPGKLAEKVANTLGAPVAKVADLGKKIGIALFCCAACGAYLYYKAHQTNLTVNVNGIKKKSINGINGYKEDERQMRSEFKKALKENCKTNNFTTKSAVSAAQMKYERARFTQASFLAKQKADAIIVKIKERSVCK
jgi:hypothetical protein